MPTDKDHELHLKEVKIDINAPENLSTATGIEVDRQLQVEGPVTVTIADIGDADAKGIQIGGASQFELTGLLTVTAEMGGNHFKAVSLGGTGQFNSRGEIDAKAIGFTGQVAVIDNSSNTPDEVSSHLSVDGDVTGDFEMKATDALQEAYGVHGYSQSSIDLHKDLTMSVSNADKVMGISARQGTQVTVDGTVTVDATNTSKQVHGLIALDNGQITVGNAKIYSDGTEKKGSPDIVSAAIYGDVSSKIIVKDTFETNMTQAVMATGNSVVDIQKGFKGNLLVSK